MRRSSNFQLRPSSCLNPPAQHQHLLLLYCWHLSRMQTKIHNNNNKCINGSGLKLVPHLIVEGSIVTANRAIPKRPPPSLQVPHTATIMQDTPLVPSALLVGAGNRGADPAVRKTVWLGLAFDSRVSVPRSTLRYAP